MVKPEWMKVVQPRCTTTPQKKESLPLLTSPDKAPCEPQPAKVARLQWKAQPAPKEDDGVESTGCTAMSLASSLGSVEMDFASILAKKTSVGQSSASQGADHPNTTETKSEKEQEGWTGKKPKMKMAGKRVKDNSGQKNKAKNHKKGQEKEGEMEGKKEKGKKGKTEGTENNKEDRDKEGKEKLLAILDTPSEELEAQATPKALLAPCDVEMEPERSPAVPGPSAGLAEAATEGEDLSCSDTQELMQAGAETETETEARSMGAGSGHPTSDMQELMQAEAETETETEGAPSAADGHPTSDLCCSEEAETWQQKLHKQWRDRSRSGGPPKQAGIKPTAKSAGEASQGAEAQDVTLPEAAEEEPETQPAGVLDEASVPDTLSAPLRADLEESFSNLMVAEWSAHDLKTLVRKNPKISIGEATAWVVTETRGTSLRIIVKYMMPGERHTTSDLPRATRVMVAKAAMA